MKKENSYEQSLIVLVFFLLLDLICVGIINNILNGSSVPVDKVSMYSLVVILVERFSFGIFSSAMTNLKIFDLSKVYLGGLVIVFIIRSIINDVEFKIIEYEFTIILATICLSLIAMLLGAYAYRFAKRRGRDQKASGG